MRLSILYVLPIVALLSATVAGDAKVEDPDDEWQDWQLTISCKNLDHFLDYSGSKLHPLTKLTVAYAQPSNKSAIIYEHLLYSSSRAIGCQRFVDPIGITPGTAGIIQLVDIPESQSSALADTILRVFLDLSLNRCMTKYVLVPHASFGAIVNALCHRGMRRDDPDDDTAGVVLEVVSDTKDESQILVQ